MKIKDNNMDDSFPRGWITDSTQLPPPGRGALGEAGRAGLRASPKNVFSLCSMVVTGSLMGTSSLNI